jgi:hypothetical protein
MDREAIRRLTLRAIRELGGSADRQAVKRKVLELGDFSEAELQQPSPKPGMNRPEYDVGWVLSDLKSAGLADNTSRAGWALTAAGERRSRSDSEGGTVGSPSPIDAPAIRDALEQVLAEYAEARRSEPFGRESRIWGLWEQLGQAFRATAPVTSRPTLKVQWSAGQGNWARVPWVAFLDARETSTTQRGVYPVLLVRQDLSGAYLTLAQGVTEPKKLGRAEAVAFLQGVAKRVRAQSPESGLAPA